MFFRAGQCAALSSFRVGNSIFEGKGYVFNKFYKRTQNKKVRSFNLLHWKGLLFDWTQWKGVSISKCRTHCLGYLKFCGPLFTHRYTVDMQAPPPPPPPPPPENLHPLTPHFFCKLVFTGVYITFFFALK